MKKIILCITISLLCFGNSAQAQCRLISPGSREWAENNREKIRKMTREEFHQLEEGYKWYAGFQLSPKQLHNFFREKIEQVRDSFEWSKVEMEHLDKLYQRFISNPDSHNFEHHCEKEAEGFTNFLEEWVKYAMAEFKWSYRLIMGMLYTHADLLDKEGNVRVTSAINFRTLDLKEGQTAPN